MTVSQADGPDIGSRKKCPSRPVALALAIPLAALPWLLLLPVDTDRAIPLAFLPAAMLGLRTGSGWKTWCLVWIGCVMVAAAALSPHTARSLVMSAAVLFTIFAGVAASSLAHDRTAVRLVLTGLVVGAISGAVMVRLGVAADRMDFPVYWSARLLGAHQFAGAIAALVLLRDSPSGFRANILPAVGGALTFTALAWSGSRAPALGLAVFIAVWAWRGGSIDRRFLLRWIPFLAVLALACSYPLGTPFRQLGWWHAFERTAGAVGESGIDIAEMTSSRTDYWKASWRQFLCSPWVGNGADAYLFLIPKQPGNQPHSAILQWLLEYGVTGTIAWCALLAGAVRAAFAPARHAASNSTTITTGVWGGAAMAGAAVYALFDGVFYHMIVFMPVAVLGGLAFGSLADQQETTRSTTSGWARVLVLLCTALLLVHNWLYLLLLKAPNVAPDSLPPRVLRAFPSTTYAIENWTERWRRSDPRLAIDWVHWAQGVSTNPGSLHFYAAQLYVWERDWAAAETEMKRCLEKANPAERDSLLQTLENIRRWSVEIGPRQSPVSSTPAAPANR